MIFPAFQDEERGTVQEFLQNAGVLASGPCPVVE